MAGPRTLLKAIGQFSVFFKRFDAASWRFATPGVDNCVVLHTVQPPLSARQPELDWPPGPPQSYGRDVPSSPPPSGAVAFIRKERGVEEIRDVFLEVASLAAVLAPGQ